jgi:hypothetical protein
MLTAMQLKQMRAERPVKNWFNVDSAVSIIRGCQHIEHN